MPDPTPAAQPQLEGEPHGLLVRLYPHPDGSGWHVEIHRETILDDEHISSTYSQGRDREEVLRLLRIYMRSCEDICTLHRERRADESSRLQYLTGSRQDADTG